MITVGAVTKNEKVFPALFVVRTGEPLPLGPYTGATKSLERPVVAAPVASFTVTVHEITSPMRTIEVDAVV